MTAYAYRDGVLAVDTKQTSMGLYTARCNKVTPLSDGRLVVGAGRVSTINAVARHIAEGEDLETFSWPSRDEDSYIHLIGPDKIQGISIDGLHDDTDDVFIGNGQCMFLMGAMAGGASAIDAVIAACWYTSDCAFPIHVWEHGVWVRTIAETDAVAQRLKPRHKETHIFEPKPKEGVPHGQLKSADPSDL